MKHTRDRDEIFQEINVIPLIDIALVLLIIFMITATIIAAGPGLNIKLPRAETVRVQKQVRFIVFIAQDGKVYLGTQETTIRDLAEKLKHEAERNEGTSIVISADKHISYEKLVEVLDAARLSGISDIALAAEAKEVSKTK
ncbi:MAG: biopolymer transporter ExbD [Candidatus Omnitrophota bacterium]